MKPIEIHPPPSQPFHRQTKWYPFRVAYQLTSSQKRDCHNKYTRTDAYRRQD